ncbi:MAG: tetratricopeptide repeat protein [Chloroflexota bacterium]
MTNVLQNLLRTKLFIPPPPAESIPRTRLLEQLDQSMSGKLSLVTAPAGYGKTTLVTSWLHHLTAQNPNTQIAWLSLDESDNDIRRFFTYFVAALSQFDASFEATIDTYLQDPRAEISTETLLISLVNQVIALEQSVTFVLDDYHEITEAAIHEALSFWLDNQPPNFHLVITSRTEPPLPLPRMRVRRQVAEIETDALRFSLEESADFLNKHMHLNLSAADIAQLDVMTEGWVASLQLAALSLQNKDDPSAFIQTFKGDNRYIVDYLVSEVLQRQPGYIRDFLLKTSILERLNVQLCNAVTEQVGSQHILETLDQDRLFLIPLDDQRRWYRYHHLFADCLQTELARTETENVTLYHERASHWFHNQGFLREAIHHAFAASNHILAADLITANAFALLWEQGEMHRLWQWLQLIPPAVVQTRPRLLITKMWLYEELFQDYGTHVDQLLDDAEALIQTPNAAYTSVEIAEVTTEIALARANVERLRGNLDKALEHCQQAMALIETIDAPGLEISTHHALTLTHHQSGNIDQALQYSNSQFEAYQWDTPLNFSHYVSFSYRIDIFRLRGELVQAQHLFENVKPYLLQRQGVGAAMLAVSCAEVLREQNRLELAEKILTPSLEILRPLPSMAVIVQTGAITLARIMQTKGKAKEAQTLLTDTLKHFRAPEIYYPSARISASKALLHLQQNNLPEAKAWAKRSDLPTDDTLIYLLEIDYLVFARILIADGNSQEAQTLLDKLETTAKDGGRITRLIEVYILKALAYQSLGEREAGLSQLEQALILAEPEGYIRIFVDEGEGLIPLLKQIAGRGLAVDYIRQLLPLFDQQSSISSPERAERESHLAENSSANMLLNPLTERELTTLRYLATELTIPEIAEQLIVAPSTVRSYVKNIYSKLDVHTRMEAVNRGRAVGLFD